MNKYGAKKTLCSRCHPHPSQLEASVCEMHILLEKAGEISDLKWQATVPLAYGIRWKIDFSYLNRFGERAYSEAKGVETRDYKLKLKMWRAVGPGPLQIWKGNARRPMLVETVVPPRAGNADIGV